MCANFQTKWTILTFLAQICPKMDSGVGISKLQVRIWNQHLQDTMCANFQFEFFGLNLGKLPNYVRYFGSNIVERVAESWVEAQMSWVEVDGAGWRSVYGLVIPFKYCGNLSS